MIFFLISELCCSMYCFASIMCRSMYFLFVLFCILSDCKCVLLPPGVNPIAVKYNTLYHISPLVSVVEQPKAWVCVRSLAGTANSDTAVGMDVCFECFV
jgi:hypothetical protein